MFAKQRAHHQTAEAAHALFESAKEKTQALEAKGADLQESWEAQKQEAVAVK